MKLEDIVIKKLVALCPDHYVLPTHDFKLQGGKGPRFLRNGNPDVIVPDALLVKVLSREMTFIEIKRKKKPFSITGHKGKQYVGIEDYKMQDYRKSANIVGADLAFVVGVDLTRTLYLIQDQKFHIHNFNNQYSTCDTCCLELDPKDIIGTY